MITNMAAETKSIWIELSEAIIAAVIFIFSPIIIWVRSISHRVSKLEVSQAEDKVKFENIDKKLDRIENKIDKLYDNR